MEVTVKLIHKLKINCLLSVYGQDLSLWEENFLSFLRNNKDLTLKQESKLNEIWNFFRSGKMHKEKNESDHSPYSKELGVSYDEIHDFDK